MTKPKKWFLDSHCNTDSSECDIVLKRSSDGAFFIKPNANAPLGPILSVEIPEEDQCGKYRQSEAVLVSKSAAELSGLKVNKKKMVMYK